MTPEEQKAKKAAYDREYRAKNRAKIRERKRLDGQTERAKQRVKDWVAANKERSREIKRAWKDRNPTADAEYRKRNPEAARQRSRAYHVANAERICEKSRVWYVENLGRARAQRTQYAKKNPHQAAARNIARRAACKQACPAWADAADIREVYVEAQYMQMHVDHIVPLVNPLVCGLHVWENLQLLTPEANRKKSNKFDPETYTHV